MIMTTVNPNYRHTMGESLYKIPLKPPDLFQPPEFWIKSHKTVIRTASYPRNRHLPLELNLQKWQD
jgi:hypothetical protein